MNEERPLTPIEMIDRLALMAAHVEHGWCQNYFALDVLGRSPHPANAAAQQWCAVGAIGAALEIDASLVWYHRAPVHQVAALLADAIAPEEQIDLPGYSGFPAIDKINRLVFFNNSRDTDQAKMLALISDAAHRLSSK